ncbi:RidA family protein [Nakamurella lactea]|uniref:RidA family protein n=1 Tax=Nakamurella lactea TaxID=459515 RepID=UPI00048FA7BC|nr:RidA family protein [Nakamurella lactea]
MPRIPITGDVPSSHLPFTPAVRAGELVFVSGQASVDDTGAYVPGTFAEEMALSFSNVERILAAAGGTMDDVVQVKAYLGDTSYRDEYNREYRKYFTEPLPARTSLSGGLGTLKFEVDVIAHIPVAT